jgi:hypothetical protein
MNDAPAQETPATLIADHSAITQPFVEAAARYSGVFYDNLTPHANVTYTSLPASASTDEICNAVMRLVQMNRAGDKRTDATTESDDLTRRRKIRRTQSHLNDENEREEKRQPSVIVSATANASANQMDRLFLGSECNKNFVFADEKGLFGDGGVAVYAVKSLKIIWA